MEWVSTILLFGLYGAFFSWLITRSGFFRSTGFATAFILGLFWLKILAGAGYGYFFTTMPDFAVQADTWRMHLLAVEEKQWLLNDPTAFLTDLFTPRYTQDSGLLGTQDSMLNDLKAVLLIKAAAVFNVLSGDRYYVNLIFFEFLTLFGQVALAALWLRFFGRKYPLLVLAVTLLVPSTLFWASGFHKEAVLLHALGWTAWVVAKGLRAKALTTPDLLGLVAHFALMFLLRSPVALCWALALAIGALVYWRPRWAAWSVPAVLVLGVVGLVLTDINLNAIDIPASLASRQAAFLTMAGESKLPMPALSPGWEGVGQYLPTALRYGLLQPLPWEVGKMAYLPLAMENLVWLLGLIPATFYFRNHLLKKMPAAWWTACLLMAMGSLILIGFTIPFVAAIDRYKSILWPLVFPPVGVWAWIQVSRYWTIRKKL